MNTAARISFIGSLLLYALLASPMHARAEGLSVVVYINGINNTLADANKTKTKIQKVLDDSTNHSGQDKRNFFVGLTWNPVGWYGTKDGPNLEQDLKELFLLKSAEELFAADFDKILAPFDGLELTIDKTAAANVTAHLNDMTPGTTSLEEGDNPVTDDDMDSTKQATMGLATNIKLVKEILAKPVIVVAHSQGNLLANLAYASLASEYGDELFKMLRVVNVANTTQFAVSNLNFTHAGDAAIFPVGFPEKSLATLPSRKNWSRHLDQSDTTKNFDIIAATFEAQNDIDGQWDVDVLLDHSITGTYLSNAEVTPNSNAPVSIFTANANSFVDRFEDFIYAAANSFNRSRLNDTGITASQCYQAGSDALVSCSSAGALALNNAQDGMTGRDAAPLTNDPSDGTLGFSFTLADGDCVLDNVTGLMWQRYVSPQRFSNYSPDYDPDGEYGGVTDASGYVAAINASGLCGHHDWRLPSADELQSIVDYGVAYGPTIDASWFPGTPNLPFWSVSPIGDNPGYGWGVSFFDGNILFNLRDGGRYVRLVRAGQ